MHKLIYLGILICTFMPTSLGDEEIENTTSALDATLRKIRHQSHKTRVELATLNSSLLPTEQTTIETTTNSEVSLRMATPCTTPNQDLGLCVAIKNCQKLLNQLGNKNASNFLHKSRCGPRNEDLTNPKVCCGKYDNYKELVKEDLFPKKCGYQRPITKSRIFGGRESNLGEYPWMARLMHKNSQNVKTFGCSGFLIAPRFILTAAHCLESENVQVLGPLFEVQLGEHNTETKIDCLKSNKTVCALKPQVIRIKKNIVHPQYEMYSGSHHHDIGLIHLKKSALFTDFVSPICLSESFNFHPYEYWISGWGRTKTQNLSPIKMKVSLKPFPFSNCTDKYKQIGVQIADNQICAGGVKNRDSCVGDSGGPLMAIKDEKWFAAGVVSYGLGCGKEGWPGVYTNVTSYMNWIRSTILKRVTAVAKDRKVSKKVKTSN